jgi:hypothetical protein
MEKRVAHRPILTFDGATSVLAHGVARFGIAPQPMRAVTRLLVKAHSLRNDQDL